jgi:hypothetical protein
MTPAIIPRYYNIFIVSTERNRKFGTEGAGAIMTFFQDSRPLFDENNGHKAISKYKVFGNNHFRVKIKNTLLHLK